MQQLSQEQVEEKFAKLDVDWSLVAGVTLTRVTKFDDFAQALAFVNRIGSIAEDQNHHPDVSLSYGSVEISITTHSVGGLTAKDFTLAQAIEEAYKQI